MKVCGLSLSKPAGVPFDKLRAQAYGLPFDKLRTHSTHSEKAHD